MITSTVDLFCYYNIKGADEEMLFGLSNMDHTTTESKFNTALYSFTIYKDCFRVFYDQWKDSEMIQKKFLDKVVVPDIENMPSNCKKFNYENINEAVCYIQNITGTKIYPSYIPSNYKIGDILPEIRTAILGKFKTYNETLGYEYE